MFSFKFLTLLRNRGNENKKCFKKGKRFLHVVWGSVCFHCSLTSFEAIIVHVFVFFAKFLLERIDFSSDFCALDFRFA